MRQGNFVYQLNLSEAYIVHRGVSQGGKKLTASQRRRFWEREWIPVPGITGAVNGFGAGDVLISLSALRVLRKENLVIVSNPEKPRVWTIKRIMESAKKIRRMEEGYTEEALSQRRGGLKL